MKTQDFALYDVICRNAQINADRDAVVFNDTRVIPARQPRGLRFDVPCRCLQVCYGYFQRIDPDIKIAVTD